MPLLEWLNDKPEDLLVPNESAWNDASKGLKESLDDIAKKYTSLGGLHVDGLKAEQVWIQAKMVMESVAQGLGSELQGDSSANEDSEEESELGSDHDEFSGSDGEPAASTIDQEMSDSDEDLAEPKINEGENLDSDDHALEELSEEELGEEDPSGDELEEDTKEQSDSEADQGRPDDQDDFDLAEFQQHVLQLEQEPEDDSDSIDYGADLRGSSDEDADLHYNDFFAPPPKKSKQERPKKKVQFADDDEDAVDFETAAHDESDDELQMDDVMTSTRKDLFDSEDEEDDEQRSNGSERMSKFEKQQLDLARQIEELENENVGEKEWGMRGEIKAAERPQDSLIDADLEFERGSKPAPVITEESTSSLEEIIKERIRKQNFDDLPRRSELIAAKEKPELPELQETKSQKSLAELYEEEQMRNANPEYYSKQDSAVMEAAHAEITDLFTSLSRRLDALCSWHFTPKSAAPSLSVVTDQPSISMEEAQPGTMASESQLAPQEIYKSEAATPMANSEMSASLKREKRREKAKKRGHAAAEKSKASPRDKDAMFSTLKKGNVTLVDRRGQKRDMRGNAVREKAPPKAANVKL